MLRPIALAACLAAAAAPAAAADRKVEQSVVVGMADFGAMPALGERADSLDYTPYVSAVERLLREETCALPGQSWKRFDITVPYAVLVEPDGSVSRVLVHDLQCPALETIVGLAAIKRLESGDFRLAGGPKARWHAAEMTFALQ